jgi:hypothetical protein
VLVKSEDQEEELLSSCYISGLPARPGRSKSEKVLVGSGNGVLTLWDRGIWDDQGERVIVFPGGKAAGESLDALAVVEGVPRVAVGCGDGSVRVVDLGNGRRVTEVLRHDDVESVVAVGFDVYSRMISGGGRTVKVWSEKEDAEDGDDEEEEGENGGDTRGTKRAGSDDDSDDSDDSSEEERSRKKKRKRGKGKGEKNDGVKNGMMGFKGLD